MFTAADIDPTATNSPKFRLIAVQCVRPPPALLNPFPHSEKIFVLPPAFPGGPNSQKKNKMGQSGCYSRARRRGVRWRLGGVRWRETTLCF